MAFEQKNNSGSLWVNDRKTTDTHPDRTGTARIHGIDFYVNGWLKKTKDGKPYLSLSFKRKDDTSGGGSVKRDMDDSIPF